MTPELRTTYKWILVLYATSFAMALFGGLAVEIAGPSTLAHLTIVLALAIACLATGFGMAAGYSLPWAERDVKPPAPKPDAPSESN